MASLSPIFVNEKNAARLLDMKTPVFLSLVERGCLPAPEDIFGHKRWRVASMEAINSGAILDEDFEV